MFTYDMIFAVFCPTFYKWYVLIAHHVFHNPIPYATWIGWNTPDIVADHYAQYDEMALDPAHLDVDIEEWFIEQERSLEMDPMYLGNQQ